MQSSYYPTKPQPPVPKTGAYAFVAADDGVPVQFNATAGALVGTLPDPSTVPGRTFIASKVDASINVVTIGALVGTINGVATAMLTDQYSCIVVMAVNGAYVITALGAP